MEEDIPKKESFFKRIYEKEYKKLLIIPALMLILAMVQIGYQTATTGDFIHKGVSLKGGLSIEILKNVNIPELQRFLDDTFPDADISVRALSSPGGQKKAIIEASDVDVDILRDTLEKNLKLKKNDYTTEVMGSSLGASFFKETLKALLLAFFFMGIVVFIYFRIPIPSLAVILAAFSDIVVTLAIINLMGMKLSTVGIAAFLMLIGYSVDTDILLSTKILKTKGGTVLDRTYMAMKTGLTMSATTLAAVTLALIFAQSDVMRQIMTIMLVGLLVDLINTWIQNAGILRWYMEKKHGQD